MLSIDRMSARLPQAIDEGVFGDRAMRELTVMADRDCEAQ
jgi:hypothetical protein